MAISAHFSSSRSCCFALLKAWSIIFAGFTIALSDKKAILLARIKGIECLMRRDCAIVVYVFLSLLSVLVNSEFLVVI